MNSLAKKFCLVGVGVGGNFVWYLNVLVIFMGLHGEGRGFKVSIWGPQSGGFNFYWRGRVYFSYLLREVPAHSALTET